LVTTYESTRRQNRREHHYLHRLQNVESLKFNKPCMDGRMGEVGGQVSLERREGQKRGLLCERYSTHEIIYWTLALVSDKNKL
jgi:hypothetical protein